MTSNSEVKQVISPAHTMQFVKSRAEEISRIEFNIKSAIVGRVVRVMSNYNGQPYGRSRKSLKGLEAKVHSAIVEFGKVYIWLEGYDVDYCALDIHEVLFVDDVDNNLTPAKNPL